ncbi:hypothetical protein [Variovorax guangxiensis]|uniref:hypothetical protein n=1 Tax=Variovorax guangxiensis TaxID=1775474 RepID=UPI00285AF1EA|nr:hypothetical protein [Variovorax guangxiensis]MDR6855558.1 hypothetical protein [Variovorax guangxiensis]
MQRVAAGGDLGLLLNAIEVVAGLAPSCAAPPASTPSPLFEAQPAKAGFVVASAFVCDIFILLPAKRASPVAEDGRNIAHLRHVSE